MDNKGVIQVLRAYVASCRENGITTVEIDAIERLADDLEADPSLVVDDKLREHRIEYDKQVRIESLKAKYAASSKHFETRVRRDELMTGMTVKTAENAVKSLLVVNGGAALSLLAFLGSIARFSDQIAIKSDIANALAIFTLGAFLAALTSGFTYLSQAGFGKEFGSHDKKIGHLFRWAAIASACLSAATFLIGARIAAKAFGADLF